MGGGPGDGQQSQAPVKMQKVNAFDAWDSLKKSIKSNQKPKKENKSGHNDDV
jgi:hypothetical protein